jgi:hypothetical protein
MGGKWGSYVKTKKTKQQVALERRRELGAKYFTPIDELVSLAATAKVKVKRLPYVPPEDPVASPPIDPGAPVTGPCQAHVDYFRAWRAAGRPRGKVAAPANAEASRKGGVSCAKRVRCVTHGITSNPAAMGVHRKKHHGTCAIERIS